MDNSSRHRLAIGIFSSFQDSGFEREFRSAYASFNAPFAQVGLMVGLLLIVGNYFVDTAFTGNAQTNLERLVLSLPIVALALSYSFSPHAKRHWQLAMSSFVVAASVGAFLILGSSEADDVLGILSWNGMLGFCFLEFYCFVVLGIRFNNALPAGLAILTAFVAILHLRTGVGASELAYWTSHALVLFLLAAGIGWWREYLVRCEFLARSRLDEALERAERFASSKSEFLASMSHEIRTPLNAIIGLIHLMRRQGASPPQLERLGRMEDAGQHLMAIINNILDLSKIEANRLQLERTNFPLSSILDNVASIVAEAARAKNVRVVVDRGEVPNWLRGDPTRLRQALLNYAANAVKFTDCGEICIRARLLGDHGGELTIRFEVSDTGPGIAAEKINQLFQPFCQADNTTTRRFGGTGLGLSITRQLAALMGGDSGVESIPGAGSTFWFTIRIPRGDAIELSKSPTHGSTGCEAELISDHSGGRILLAEDDPLNRQVALELLNVVGLHVKTVGNGREALEAAGNGKFDLILMDMQMPLLGGIEATRAIRLIPGWERVPIIALTANAFSESRRECEDAGMNDFLTKPMTPEALYGALQRWLPKHSSTSFTRCERSENWPSATAAKLGAQGRVSGLAGVPGLEIAKGRIDMNGNPNAYLRILRRFVTTHSTDMALFAIDVPTRDLVVLGAAAHSLKGAAGNIGASSLADAAEMLEFGIRRGAGEIEINKGCKALLMELGPLLGRIEEFLDGVKLQSSGGFEEGFG